MSSKITPGPWGLYIAPDTGVIAVCTDDSHRYDIAHFNSITNKHTGTKEIKLANARAIAAVPEIIELLNWVARGEHHPTCINRKRSKSHPDKCDCQVGAAKALLAKIEGKEVKP